MAEEFVNDKVYESKYEITLITKDIDYSDIMFSPTLKEYMNEDQVKVIMDIFISLILENGGDSYRSNFVFSFCYVFKESEAFSTLINQILGFGFEDLYMRLISHCETENYTSYSMMRMEMKEGHLGADTPVKYLNLS